MERILRGTVRQLGGRKAGMVMIILVVGLNAAYLLKHGTGIVLVITALLVVLAVAGIMIHFEALGGVGASEEQPRMIDHVRNGALAFLLAVSLYGIFG